MEGRRSAGDGRRDVAAITAAICVMLFAERVICWGQVLKMEDRNGSEIVEADESAFLPYAYTNKGGGGLMPRSELITRVTSPILMAAMMFRCFSACFQPMHGCSSPSLPAPGQVI